MYNIRRMSLRLPAGFEHRAGEITRQVSECLAEQRPLRTRDIDRLVVGPVRIEAQASDSEVARHIADAIAYHLEGAS